MPNRLARETSPYLRQHADNPVDWQPWDAAALEQAERENRPILLSIGYSACHWCHVMAHESFEDEATAALMNELFVNIKVDREERPDLDRVYQIAHQLLARRPGGWPLTVFLTPRDRMPFFAGTYFPRLPRHGMPAFGEVLQRVADFHRENAAGIAQQSDSLADVFRRIERGGEPASGGAPDRAPIQAARHLLEQEFDARHGGFGSAPKFPQPGALSLFLRAALRGDRPAERMALFSLERMAAGGLFDQVGGGFFRYCVDAAWEIPHFEKMLYDNAALLPLYAEAAARSGAPQFRDAVRGTAAWLTREMRLDGGAFAASLDADNPEGEGAGYTWDREELRTLLPEADFRLLEQLFGLDAAPNFEGRWHLNLRRTPEQLGTATGTDPEAIRQRRDALHARLLDIRQQRPRPGRDDKCLTAWNALLVTGLVRAGLLLGEPDLCRLGETALHWLDRHAWAGGRLHSVWTDGAVRQPAFLDDVAFLLQAQLTALQYRWQAATLTRARALADLLLREFEDTGAGGFFFTPADGEQLIHRPKSFADESLPAGNAIAAAALLQLGWLLGEDRYLAAAGRCLRAAAPALERAPQAHCSLLNALDDFLDPPPQVILRGGPEAMAAFRRELPADARVALFAIPADAEELPPALQAHAVRGERVAYLCRGTHCEAPCTEPSELAGRLRGEH